MSYLYYVSNDTCAEMCNKFTSEDQYNRLITFIKENIVAIDNHINTIKNHDGKYYSLIFDSCSFNIVYKNDKRYVSFNVGQKGFIIGMDEDIHFYLQELNSHRKQFIEKNNV